MCVGGDMGHTYCDIHRQHTTGTGGCCTIEIPVNEGKDALFHCCDFRSRLLRLFRSRYTARVHGGGGSCGCGQSYSKPNQK